MSTYEHRCRSCGAMIEPRAGYCEASTANKGYCSEWCRWQGEKPAFSEPSLDHPSRKFKAKHVPISSTLGARR